MSISSLTQVLRYPLYPAGFYAYTNSYHHRSYPAPGPGSTGVQEYGFGKYHRVVVGQRPIPTITFLYQRHLRQVSRVQMLVPLPKPGWQQVRIVLFVLNYLPYEKSHY
jgi:hypothetical protein